MTSIVTIASLNEDIEKLIRYSQVKLDSIKEKEFANPLDFTHNKAKLKGYLERMDEAKILLGKSKEVEEFSLLLKKEIDAQTNGYTKLRSDILDKEENGEDSNIDGLMYGRGLVNGKILAITHLGVLINTADNTLAKELVIKLGKDKPINN